MNEESAMLIDMRVAARDVGPKVAAEEQLRGRPDERFTGAAERAR
jgi:hypothetical protein